MLNFASACGVYCSVEGAIEAYTKADQLMPDTPATAKALAACKAKLAEEKKKAAAPAAASAGGGAATPAAAGGDPKKAAAMAESREGWLSVKEGKIRKKWVRYWYQIKECKLVILTCEPGGNVPPENKGEIDLSSFTAVEKNAADTTCKSKYDCWSLYLLDLVGVAVEQFSLPVAVCVLSSLLRV